MKKDRMFAIAAILLIAAIALGFLYFSERDSKTKEIADLTGQIGELQAEVKDKEEQIGKLKETLSEKEAETEALKQSNPELQKQVNELLARVEALETGGGDEAAAGDGTGAAEDVLLYYNPDGGEYYHLDRNCQYIAAEYLPLKGEFRLSELENEEYSQLKPCALCGAPQRSEAAALPAGDGPVMIPDVLGMTMDEALSELNGLGMDVSLECVMNGDIPMDTVISQSPAPGETADAGAEVMIRISGGKTVIPSVTGMTLAEAEELLTLNQLNTDIRVEYLKTEKQEENGTVAGQMPEAGCEVMPGAGAALQVYRYPSDQSETTFDVTLKENIGDVMLEVTLQAEGSDAELIVFEREYTTDMERIQPVTVQLPDDRTYTCTVLQNGDAGELFTVGR